MKTKSSKILLIIFSTFIFTACSVETKTSSATVTSSAESADDSKIYLSSKSVTYDGIGVSVSGTTITITNPGKYTISGTLDDGQIIINAGKDSNVNLVFANANITCSTSAPIYIIAADTTTITLESGSTNTLTDASTYQNQVDDEPDATLFSKDDLIFEGSGTLTITAKYNDAIKSKDGLVVNSGTYNITSANDGIQGKDYVLIKDGTFNITSSQDGIKSTNEEDSGYGYITIKGGTFNLSTANDGIQAVTNLTIEAGTFAITSGGGSSATLASDASAKGLKAGTSVTVSGGTFNINAADDTIHSNNSITINGGTLALSTGDDGIHADTALTINGGTTSISKSYEGLESKTITINDGEINVVSSDDGINGSEGSTSSSAISGGSFPGGGGGGGGSVTVGNAYFYMNGGVVYVNASGDGVDINGSAVMTGGVLLVDGPTANDNGPLDYDGTFKITGGLLVATGSSGMSMAPSTTSTQYSVLVNFSSSRTAQTMLHIRTSSGTELLTFVPSKTYQSVAFSSSNLTSGTTYDLYTGGTSTGTDSHGLYENGTYSGGTKYTSFTISSITTTIR